MQVKNKTLMKTFAGVCAFTGMLILTYEITTSERFGTYLSPIPDHSSVNSPQGYVDYTKPANWFSGEEEEEDNFKMAKVSYYTITIPRLKIKDATVSVGG